MSAPTLASRILAAHGGGGKVVVPAGPGSLASRILDAHTAPVRTPVSHAAPPAKHHGGGGVTGFLGHLVNQGASDLEHAAVSSFTGTYKIGKDLLTPAKGESLSQQWSDLLHGHLHFAKGDPLQGDVQGIKQGYEDILHHPLRHPGYTLLSVLPFASGLSKLAIAGREGAIGAPAGSTVARSLTHGGLTVHPESSRSGLGQLTQKTSDALLTHAAAKKPAGRAAKILQAKVGKTITADAKQAQRNARGPAEALIRLGSKLSKPQQKALQIVAEQAPLDGRITAASARVIGAKTPKARAAHQEELHLLHEAKPLLTVENGKPVLAAGNESLVKVLDKMAKVAGDRETLLKGLGLLTDESSVSRKTDAGRVALGASFENPTPGKLGVPSAGLLKARNYVARLETLHNRALDKIQATKVGPEDAIVGTRIVGPGVSRLSGAKAAVDQSAARLNELERIHANALDKIAAGQFGPISRADVNARTKNNLRAARQEAGVTRSGKKSGASTEKAIRLPSMKLERRNQAEKLTEQFVTANPSHPVSAAWRKRTEEIDKLRALVTPEFGVRPRGLVTGAGRVVGAPGSARADRLGGALSVARERWQQMEAAAGSRVKPTGILGAEHFTAGPDAIRIPDVATRQGTKTLGKIPAVGGQGTVGNLKAPGSVTHGYTGALREHAVRRQDTTRLVGESGLEASKYAALKHVHDLVRKAAGSAPLHEDDVAVRLDSLKAHEKMPLQVRRLLSDPHEFFDTASPAETASAFEQVRQRMFIQPKTLSGEARAEFEKLAADGKIGWVPRRVLGELGKSQAPLRAVAPGKAVGTVDAINNATRFAILYLKPAYAIPNMLGNTALALVQQGWAAPRNLAIAARLVQKLHEEDYARIDAAMGEGVARAVSAHGEGKLSRVTDFAAGKWSKAVDTPFRRASFIHEARRAGFKTPEQLHELLTRDAHDPELIRVGVTANRDAIDYENLTNTEREIVRRIVFLYPWVKGSTVYAGRFLRDHPIAAAATVPAAQIGDQWDQQQFGALPSYLQGLIPFGKDRALNPSAAAILQTPAQVLQAAQGLATGNIPQAAQAANFFTPALGLALAEASRRRSNGVPYKPGTSGLNVALDTLTSSLPQVSLAKALLGKSHAKLYPPTPSNAIGQFLLGGVFPRKLNRAQLAQLAAAEQTRMKTGY